ncbi:hypothetical protein Tco_0774815 [Tanacetum coccineum]|uniref:Uncharacterized protein n=1 Tax=Tanacetum coccineum TaxID=301880 RepID=A0ABQ4ZPK0_9ASTR
MGRLKLLEDFYVINMEKDPAAPLLIGKGFLATVGAVIDYRKAKITIGGATRSIFRVKEINLGDEEIPYWTTLGKIESYEPRPSTDGQMARDAIINQFKDDLVFKNMVEFLGTIPINLKGNMWELEELIKKKIDWSRPPKDKDGVWHIRIELIDLDGEKFKKTFQSIPTTRKLSEKENPIKIIDLDQLHDF